VIFVVIGSAYDLENDVVIFKEVFPFFFQHLQNIASFKTILLFSYLAKQSKEKTTTFQKD